MPHIIDAVSSLWEGVDALSTRVNTWFFLFCCCCSCSILFLIDIVSTLAFWQVNFLWAICYLLVIVYSILILVGPIVLTWIVPKDEWCGLSETSSTLMSGNGGATANGIDDDGEGRRLLSGDFTVKESSAEHSYANPDYIMDPCRYLRVPELLYVTLEECDMSRRLLCSVILGGIIGYERRSADRPAGIRTMGLVSLGACSFTISSIMAFKSSTMGWDASRVTAALPSGVGFLGGALIWKGSIFVHDEEVHQVHGLTTAASLWLSAAVGVGIGGALYLVTTYVVIIVVAILRYAPKSYSLSYLDEEEEEEEEEKEEEEYDEQEEEKEPKMPEKSRFGAGPWLGGENVCNTDETDYSEKGERAAHLPETKQGSSLRRRSTSERSSVPQSNQRARSVRNLVPTFAE